MKNRTTYQKFNGKRYFISSIYIEFGFKFSGDSLEQEYIKYIKLLYESNKRTIF